MWGSQYDEILQNNPFFSEINTNHADIIQSASQNGWIICVPRTNTVPIPHITSETIADHILVPCQTLHSFLTLSNKKVSLINKEITSVDRPTAPVRVLFEETFYLENLKYSVFCLEKPLFVVCDTPEPPSLETLHDCIDFLWSENLGHVLGRIQEVCRYFLEHNPGFGMEDSQSLRDLVAGLLSQCLQLVPSTNPKIELAVEAYMQSCLDRNLVKAVNTLTCFNDAAFNKIVRNSSDLRPEDLTIPEHFCDILSSAKHELNKINNYATILDKTNCLKLTVGHLNNAKVCLTSDVILLIFIFLITKLDIGTWIANLVYLTHFRFSSWETSSESSFLVSSLEAAIEFIKSDRFDQIKSSRPVANPFLQDVATLPQDNGNSRRRCHPLCDCASCADNTDSDFPGQGFLIHATVLGHSQVVQMLIARGADVNAFDCSGKTALHYACLKGHQDILLVLVNCKAKVNVKDSDGNAPLHLACNNKHNSCAKALLYTVKDLEINGMNKNGDTALHLALKWNYVDVARLLIENGADVTVPNKNNQLPADLAQNHYTERILKLYHPEVPALLSAPKHLHGIRPKSSEQTKKIDSLLKAVENNDLPLTCFYLGFCSDCPHYDFRSKCHPLCDCVKCGESEERPSTVVDKVNVNSCNVDGFTPLHFAAKYGRTEILRILLDSGALPNLKTYKTLQTPLHLACICQRLAIVKELVKCECDIDARDYKINTPLDYACAKDDAKIVGVLLSNGAECQGHAGLGKEVW